MPRERPTSVLVIAILHLIGGSLGLMIFVCGAAFQLSGGQRWINSMAGPMGQKQQEQTERMEKAMQRHLPGNNAVGYADVTLNGILSLMMVAAGIGLLAIHSWARLLSIVYALLSILHKVFALLWGVLFAVPGMQRFFAEEGQRDPALAQMSAFMGPSMYAGLVFGFLFIIYPIAVLVIMLKPSTRAAFQGQLAKPEEEGWGRPRMERSGESTERGEPDEGHYRPGDRRD